MCACARALAQRTEKETRDLEECASRAITLRILQKEKKVVFTAATHRSISRVVPFWKYLNVSLTRDAWIFKFFTNANTRLSTSNAHLSFFTRARAHSKGERERQSLLLFLLRRKGEREREREIFFRSPCFKAHPKRRFSVELSFPTKKKKKTLN